MTHYHTTMNLFKEEANRPTRHPLLLAVLLAGISLETGEAFAQIVPDATLPNNTIVTPSGNSFDISGGTTAGSNLFHSFTEFGVPTGSEAFFNNAPIIDNIITRVTGGKISNIDGLIRANGTANLFLINPNGIVFGPNARLDIGGSFFGSTAESILFENDRVFSATNPKGPPLLRINVPLGLQYGPSGRPIVNQSTVGLEVKPGNTLALIGGNVSLEGGQMRAPSGRIALSSVGDFEQVSITSTENGFRLGYNGVNNFQDVELSGGATVDVSGTPSGELQVQGRTFRLGEDAKIISINSGSQGGGGIQINATELVELIGTGNYLEGLVGLADNGIANNATLPSGLFATTVDKGSGGDIAIDTSRLIASNGIFIYGITEGEGRGGDLRINASESVELREASLRANVFFYARGNGGNLTVKTGRLLLEEVAEIGAVVEGRGSGGNLEVNASESIDLVGTNLIVTRKSDGTPFITNTAFFASTEIGSSGNAGEMRLSTGRLSVSNGAALVVQSIGTGRPGNLFLTARESVEFIGSSPGGNFTSPSSILAGALNSLATETGGANVTITTGNLILRNEGTIAVSNLAVGSGGSLEVVANSILLDDRAGIEAETAFGEGGNIVLRTQDLRLRDNSKISVTGGSAENPVGLPSDVAGTVSLFATGVGDGGNSIISTDTLVALENSDITANAREGFGGRVLVTALGVFGTQFRSELTDQSDITATSALGASFSGVVQIKIPDVDRARGIIKLPESSSTVSSLVGKDFCSLAANSSFVITGRGGIPSSPGDILSGTTTRVNLVDPVFGEETRDSRGPVARDNTRSGEIVEAQGWYVNDEGVVVLTANPNVVNSHASRLVHPSVSSAW